MPAERRVHPAFREEDVSGPLNFLEQLEAGTDVLRRCARAQRMMQISDAVEHPRLAAAVGRIAERLKEAIAHGGIVRERRLHELQARLPISILRSLDLPIDDRLPVRNGAYSKL